MIADVLLATGVVDTVKVAVFVFTATVTLTGTEATDGLLLDSVTTAPPAGAGPFSVTVPVDRLPPLTELGLSATEVRLAAVTVNVAVLVVPLYVPEMVTEVLLATGIVVTVNVAVVAFAATVTLAGTIAAGLLLVRATTAPPGGAAAFSVTVPVDELPPLTELGLSATEVRFAGVTVNVAVLVTLL